MGYYTRFKFSIEDYGNSKVTNSMIAIKIIKFNRENDDSFYPLVAAGIHEYLDDISQYAFELTTDKYKWYDYKYDMLQLSRTFPDVVFKLHGEGEENGDIWDEYYQNNKTCRYALPRELPPFNPKDLHKPKLTAKPTNFF